MSLLITEIYNKVGCITLNAEKSLNSLTLEMIKELQLTLDHWKGAEEVACVFLRGAGQKAFCAGGDVRKLYEAIVSQKAQTASQLPQECLDFFANEYQMDYTIHTYPKPIIVWGHGIVMGGGLGLMAGASHRVVTEKSKLAMPEITIGLFPDVAGTWFLNRMPSAYGLYLGLTGTRLEAADCLFLGLADYYIDSMAQQEVLEILKQAPWEHSNPHNLVSEILEEASKQYSFPVSQAAAHQAYIEKFEGVSSLEEFIEILNTPANQTDDWVQAGIKTFQNGSPSSAYVIFRQLQEGKGARLETVFQSELNLACQCCLHPDFAEGVRALLIDKDQSPQWQPPTLQQVSSSWIEGYFAPLWQADNHPLHHLGRN